MNRISRSFKLAGASWNVLRQDNELTLLPVMSAAASLVIVASFAVPIFVSSGGDLESTTLGPLHYVSMFAMYLALSYVTVFFNAALVHAANDRMSGGNPTLGSALRGAANRATAILPWAVVSATVSVILRAIQERAGFLGQFVVGLVGLAWTLVTYLVLPILVIEGIGVRDALKESADMFKRTWGENVTAQIGFGLVGFLAALPAIGLLALSISQGGAVAVVGITVSAAMLAVVAVVMATLSGIFQTALYRYARSESTGSFDTQLLAQSFAPKEG